MRLQRLSSMASMATLLFLLFGFGTEAVNAATYQWNTGATSGSWTDNTNWILIGGTGNTNGWPDSTDQAIFSSDAAVTLGQDLPIAELLVQSGAVLTLTTSYTLTMTTLTVMGGELKLSDNGTGTNYVISTEHVALSGGATITGVHSGRTVKVEMRRSVSGTISMTDVNVDYVGLGIHTTTKTGSPFITAARFDDDITFDGASEISLGAHNLYLGKECTLTVPPAAVGDQNPPVFRFDSKLNGQPNYAGTGVGYLCREVSPTALGPRFFPVFPTTGDRSGKYVPIEVEITFTDGLGWDNSVTPWPHIAVRVMGYPHPANQQTKPTLGLYWVVKGVGVPEGLVGGMICVKATMYYHEYYRYNGSDKDKNVFSGCYTDNYLDPNPYNSPTGWDIVGQQQVLGASSGNTVIYGGAAGTCIPHFGDYTIGFGDPSGDPLPVELSAFSARPVDGGVRLNWRTATETNNFGFAVERSVDGEDWQEVGFVQGHGTTFSPKHYEHLDVLPAELTRLPRLAYRLRQMDRDGTTDYSNIVSVRTGELPEGIELYAAYPNPFNPSTTISFAISQPAGVTLKVYNALGQVVATLLTGMEMEAGLHTVPFSGETLPSGIYMAVLEAGGAVQHQKLVLNK